MCAALPSVASFAMGIARLIPLILVLCVRTASAQVLAFEMSVFGITFGTMTVARTQENDSTELYTLTAKGKTDFLWMQREEESRYQVRYRNGIMQSSDYIYLNRGKKEKWAKVQRAGDQYRIETHTGVRLMHGPIRYSLLRLYFDPERNVDQVFCEEDCSYSSLQRKSGTGEMLVTCKNGNSSTYHISKGRVQGLDIHLPVATVRIKQVR